MDDRKRARGMRPTPAGFLAGFAAVAAVTVVGRILFPGAKQLADVVMVYLLAIVFVSLRWGLWPSLFATVLAVLGLDFFFIPPFNTLAVADITHVPTFVVMFVVAALISGLTKRVRDQSEAARERELRVETELLRNSLLSSVSHDLRTPLAVITGAASTLKDGKVAPETRAELTGTILTEAERLNRLVRNLLDMTRLDAGAVVVKKEWQPVEEAVGAALERVEAVVGDRPIVTDLPSTLPLVPFDSILLQQVLVNLLENAAKYTPPGTEIAVSAREREGAVEIVVSDRGPGLRPGEEEKIFGKFYRAEQGRGGGVGLGLTICKGIVTAHGGKLWATARPEGGAAFHFTLPIEGSPPSMDEAAS